ncbi:beta-galactosidase GanA [Saccharothrix ecbatanensis]|uniref:Beta-galactosidase GanA n=1 Tax=Saccharothrix ecbatanensis TaxID=1105145 RepID=A0A7W9HJR2_9PSEU|nr:Beta-galactosidase C-terminal domain [Saccharothrix ecbatanensis]MBB5803552.1 beta-galactosidase GanA [Saccharothrix ecbatanensis]
MTTHWPTALMPDHDRFCSDSLLDHSKAERDIIRQFAPTTPITTNLNRAKASRELVRDSLGHIACGADGALFFRWWASLREPGGGAGPDVVRREKDGTTWVFALNHGDEARQVALKGVEVVTGETVDHEPVVPGHEVRIVRERR